MSTKWDETQAELRALVGFHDGPGPAAIACKSCGWAARPWFAAGWLRFPLDEETRCPWCRHRLSPAAPTPRA